MRTQRAVGGVEIPSQYIYYNVLTINGVPGMKVERSQAQLVYEVGLKMPAFELATNGVPVVKTIHAAFSGRFNVTPADMHVASATRLSDWVARLSLFNGQWSVEYRFSGYLVTCNLLTTDN